VLWEVFADAEEPYGSISTEVEVGLHVRRGGRLPRPRAMCDDLLRDSRTAALGRQLQHELYGIMRECWAAEPASRPTAAELKLRLLAVSEVLQRAAAEAADAGEPLPMSIMATPPVRWRSLRLLLLRSLLLRVPSAELVADLCCKQACLQICTTSSTHDDQC
jgi:hypothetical protein